MRNGLGDSFVAGVLLDNDDQYQQVGEAPPVRIRILRAGDAARTAGVEHHMIDGVSVPECDATSSGGIGMTKKAPTDIPASVSARLLNHARATKHDFNRVLVR